MTWATHVHKWAMIECLEEEGVRRRVRREDTVVVGGPGLNIHKEVTFADDRRNLQVTYLHLLTDERGRRFGPRCQVPV